MFLLYSGSKTPGLARSLYRANRGAVAIKPGEVGYVYVFRKDGQETVDPSARTLNSPGCKLYSGINIGLL